MWEGYNSIEVGISDEDDIPAAALGNGGWRIHTSAGDSARLSCVSCGSGQLGMRSRVSFLAYLLAKQTPNNWGAGGGRESRSL